MTAKYIMKAVAQDAIRAVVLYFAPLRAIISEFRRAAHIR